MGAALTSLTVEPFDGNTGDWQDFLARSANGTLFHDLEFLGYHPAGRHHFHHLTVRKDGKLFALLPGGLRSDQGQTLFSSPLGASVGGFAVQPGLRAEAALELVEVVKTYARLQKWRGMEITLPPALYNAGAADLIGFALFCGGFRLQHRWLCHLLPLDADWSKQFSSRQAGYVRAAQRAGATTIQGGIELLDTFAKPFADTFDRHGSSPTHSLDEIKDLMQRFPERIRIHLAMLKDEPLAGLLVFHVTTAIAYTMYIVRAGGNESIRGDSLVIADAMTRLTAGNYSHLDLGPSASDMNVNKGVAFFKEGLRASGSCRDRWQWTAES